jgi:hypothetical protein
LKFFILLLGTILLILIWTNPSTADFERWVQEEAFTTDANFDAQRIFVRSRSYLFFSYHEFYASYVGDAQVQTQKPSVERMDNFHCSGFGILKNFILVSSSGIGEKKSPAIK